jgi:hypothetical protein
VEYLGPARAETSTAYKRGVAKRQVAERKAKLKKK